MPNSFNFMPPINKQTLFFFDNSQILLHPFFPNEWRTYPSYASTFKLECFLTSGQHELARVVDVSLFTEQRLFLIYLVQHKFPLTTECVAANV